MDPEVDGCHVREIDESTGAAMINVAMALMREIKNDLGRMNDKLDDIARERRDEAREHGGLEVRVTTLESSHKVTRGITSMVAATCIVAFLYFLIRIAVSHPDVVTR
jgi:archaellum component FlaC